MAQAPYRSVLSRAWALGAHDTPHWARASQLLKASYHVGAPGLTPQDLFNGRQYQWGRYQSPVYLAPRANPDPDASAVLLDPNRMLPAVTACLLSSQETSTLPLSQLCPLPLPYMSGLGWMSE